MARSPKRRVDRARVWFQSACRRWRLFSGSCQWTNGASRLNRTEAQPAVLPASVGIDPASPGSASVSAGFATTAISTRPRPVEAPVDRFPVRHAEGRDRADPDVFTPIDIQTSSAPQLFIIGHGRRVRLIGAVLARAWRHRDSGSGPAATDRRAWTKPVSRGLPSGSHVLVGGTLGASLRQECRIGAHLIRG